MGRIVVGIDGSEQAVEALRWAIGEARLRGATIDAIDAWNYPYVVVPGAPIPLHPRADQADDVEQRAGAGRRRRGRGRGRRDDQLHRHRGRPGRRAL